MTLVSTPMYGNPIATDTNRLQVLVMPTPARVKQPASAGDCAEAADPCTVTIVLALAMEVNDAAATKMPANIDTDFIYFLPLLFVPEVYGLPKTVNYLVVCTPKFAAYRNCEYS